MMYRIFRYDLQFCGIILCARAFFKVAAVAVGFAAMVECRKQKRHDGCWCLHYGSNSWLVDDRSNGWLIDNSSSGLLMAAAMIDDNIDG